jgi:hypothetical protein
VRAAADAAAAIEAGAASVKELLKLQLLQQQRWQQQQQLKPEHQPAQQQEHSGMQQQQQQQQHDLNDEQRQEQSQVPQATSAVGECREVAIALTACSSEDALMSSLTAAEFEEVSRDVAARIIQAHWRLWRDTRQQQQQQRQSQPLQQQQMPEHEHTADDGYNSDAADSSIDGQWQRQQEQQPASVLQRQRSDSSMDSQHWDDDAQHAQQQAQQLGTAVQQGLQQQQQRQGQEEGQGEMEERQDELHLQQLLEQLQLDPTALAALNSDSQLRALLAAALQQQQQVPEETSEPQHQWQQQQQSQDYEEVQSSYSGSCESDPAEDAAESMTQPNGTQLQQQQQQQGCIDAVSKAVSDQQQPNTVQVADASEAAAAEQWHDAGDMSVSSSPSKPAALGRLRLSMEGRQAMQLQQYLAAAGPALANQGVLAAVQPPGNAAHAAERVSAAEASSAAATAIQPVAAVAAPGTAAGSNACSAAPSVGAEKLGTILAFLDAVDAEAEQEAAALTAAPVPASQSQLLSR